MNRLRSTDVGRSNPGKAARNSRQSTAAIGPSLVRLRLIVQANWWESILAPTHLIKYMNRHNANTSQKMRDIAQQLLSYEAAADSNSETNISAPYRVLEALRRPLCTLVGVQGFRVLLARALTLGRAKVPSLSAVTVNPDGSLAGFSDLNADEISTAGVVLTAQLLGLLATFIGGGLMRRILLGVWPDLTVLDASGSGDNE